MMRNMDIKKAALLVTLVIVFIVGVIYLAGVFPSADLEGKFQTSNHSSKLHFFKEFSPLWSSILMKAD